MRRGPCGGVDRVVACCPLVVSAEHGPPPPPLEKLLRPASSALPQSAQANLLSPGGAEARGAVTGPDVPTGHSQGALCPIPELTAP